MEETVVALSLALQEATTPAEVGRAVSETAAEVFAADVAGILLLEDSVFRPVAAVGAGADRAFREYRSGLDSRSIFSRALREEGAVSSRDLLKDPRTGRRMVDLLGVRAVTAIPLAGSGRVLGALFLGLRAPGHAPAEDSEELLTGIAALAAVALERASLLADFRKTSREADQHARQLKARREELERLIFLLSHDLRTPVVSIQNFIHYLETEVGDELPEEARFYLKRIGVNCEHLNNLIRGILDLTQVGRDEQSREEVELADLVAEVLAALDAEAGSGDVEVDVGELPAVRVDRTRIFQVFQNLVGNALVYGEARDGKPLRIRITGEDDGERVRIRVWNSGSTIPEGKTEEVFDLFHRLPDAVERHPGGTGAGLAIVRRIVEAHGGEVGVAMKEDGPEFWLTLPRADGA